MKRRTTKSTRTDTLFPYTTSFRSALNSEHDNRIRPLQQIGDDDANALARSGRRFEQYMLHHAHHKEAVADAAEHNALFRAKARLADFAFALEGGFNLYVPFRPQDERLKQHRQRHAHDRASTEHFGPERTCAAKHKEAGTKERIIEQRGTL